MDTNQSGVVTWNEYWAWVKKNLPAAAENLEEARRQKVFDAVKEKYLNEFRYLSECKWYFDSNSYIKYIMADESLKNPKMAKPAATKAK